MGSISYPRHFAILGCIVGLWGIISITGLRLSVLRDFVGDGFLFFFFGVIGALHATSLVAALKGSISVVVRVGFIAGAAVLSIGVPFIGIAVAKALASEEFVLFGVGSAAGALMYWLLAKQLVLPHLRFRSLGAVVLFCTSATLIVVAIEQNFPQLLHDLWPRVTQLLGDLSYTVAWWVTFSVSLFVTEDKHGS
jgi:hypothetical protein